MKKFCKGLALVLVIVYAFSFAACNNFDKESTESTYSWSEWTLETAPTCATEGLETRVSLNGTQVVETRSVPVKHDWADWEETNSPSCLVSGVEKRLCKNCGNSDFRSVPALGHDWGDWEIMNSSCTESDAEMRVCKHNNNHIDIRTASISGHDWTDWVVTTAPDCTGLGVETRFCRNDNSHTESRSVSVFGHDWTDWVITSYPTETTDGVETRFCKNDKSHAETRKIYATGTSGLNYQLINNTEYTVNNYAGSSKNVTVPAFYNNLPVTRIASFAFAWKEIENYVIGANIRFIDDYAFYAALGMRTLIFENGSKLESIGKSAFWGCGLESIEIPASTKRIEEAAFALADVENVTFANGDNIEFIGDSAFVNCYKLKTIEVPSTLTEIKDHMFYGCLSMTRITFANPDRITKIGVGAFMYCYALENFEIPANVTVIGAEAFYMAHQTSKLKSIKINADTITKIGDWTFGDWDASQTIYIVGFSSQAEADAAWGTNWRRDCRAAIIYSNPKAELFSKILVKDGIDCIDYNVVGEIKQVARFFDPLYDNDGEIAGYYLSFESLLICVDMGDGFADCSVNVTYYPDLVTKSVWNGQKVAHENITYLSEVRITVDFNNVYSQGYEMFDRILLFTETSGIWDLENVWKEYRETALIPTENRTQYNQQKVVKF